MLSSLILKDRNDCGLCDAAIREALDRALAPRLGALRKVLLVPPDITRANSGAGAITAFIYQHLQASAHVDVMPALGTHEPMTRAEALAFFGEGLPFERLLVHNWRSEVVRIGQVPGDFVAGVSDGLVTEPIDVEVNRHLLAPSYDLILSIGQVVPHEVVGMANYSKNILVGCGGSAIINRTHMLGAFYGMERMMGRDGTPVRKVLDYAEGHFLQNLPLAYILTVTTTQDGATRVHGLFIGRERRLFEEAVRLSQAKNLTFLDRAPRKIVVNLDAQEFKSTWLGNKAIYRTRMAIADGGELIVLAPGVRKFGEDEANDKLIRKYGYVGRKRVLELVKQCHDLQANLSVAAHLIHGSPDGRFRVTYAGDELTRAEVEGVAFQYQSHAEAVRRYNPATLREGFNNLPDGEELFYISNPALGLWAERKKFELVE